LHSIARSGIPPRRTWILAGFSALILSACSAGSSYPDVYFDDAVTAAELPTLRPTMTDPPVAHPAATPAIQDNELYAIMEDYGLAIWESQNPEASRYPISNDVLGNPSTYGALIDELHAQLARAAKVNNAVIAAGHSTRAEIYWNGIASYTGNTDVEIFLRDSTHPDQILWLLDPGGTAAALNAEDITGLVQHFPDSSGFTWENPGTFRYLDDPTDEYSRGMHLIDGRGTAIAFWDQGARRFAPWLEKSAYRYKLVNGFDLDFFGFEADEVDMLWDAFHWFSLVLEDPKATFAGTQSIRTTNLPLWIAGIADQSDIRLDPASLSFFQDFFNAPRDADVLWTAALVIHEAAHVNQPGECSPGYAATQGMTFSEYALFLETGPGQAYEQELEFWTGLRDLRDGDGRRWIADPEVRKIIEDQIGVIRGTLGRDHFPNGELVPTCASG
jgi:hypothetical protein